MNVEQMLSEIQDRGYTIVKNFVPRTKLDLFMPEVYNRFSRQSYNGTVGYVRYSQQKYLQWTLTVHPEILRLYLNSLIVETSEKYVGTPVHLQDYRIYQNNAGMKMTWHVDNKQTLADGSSRMLSNKGLIVILYLEDVNHGPFEIVSGSHHWAWKESLEVWDDRAKEFEKNVVTFNNLPAGTMIMYDFRCIHRAQPFAQGSPRTALFAQYSGVEWPTGEPIFLEAGALANLSAKDMQVLRFGRPASGKTWPVPPDLVQTQEVSAMGDIARGVRKLWHAAIGSPSA